MAAATVKYFDTHEFVKKSKELGASEELAEFQVKKIEQAIETAVTAVKEDLKNQELATKRDIKDLELATKRDIKDLELKIAETKNQIIIWVAGLFIASGLMQHFIK
jgi:hypothetical protein